MKRFRFAIFACLVLSLAACGGGDDLSIELPAQREGTGTDELLELKFPPGQAVEHRLPFRISGGVRPYESSIEGCPDWVTLLPDQGILSGTAPESERDRTFFCAYRVSDAGGLLAPQSVSYGLRIAVGSLAPVLTLPRPSKIDLVVGTYQSEALPAATGGIAPHTYSFTCAGGALPPGMGFAAATRMFAGTPDAGFRDSCTYTVTDSSQPAATVSVAVEVEVSDAVTEPLTLPRPGKIDIVVGSYHGEALPAATGGIAPHTYSFICAGGALPPGMGFAPLTRMFAGTPQARFHDSCTYTVTDSSRPAATVSVAVEVEVSGATTEPLTLPRPGKIDLVVGTYQSEALPAATGGVMPYTYSFNCAGGALPPGMGFAAATRMFAGTPLARFHDSCTFSATDSSQPSAMVSVAVEVEVTDTGPDPLTLPENVVVEGDDPGSLTVRQRVSVTFAEAMGGVRPYTYELLCALPRDLDFSPDTRVLSGTSLEVYRGPDCTYRVTDSASPPASVSRSVALIVDPLDRGTWRFRTRTLAGSDHPLRRRTGERQDFVILPHAVGGTGLATYALHDRDYPLHAPELPLEFDRQTRVLSYRHTGVDPILDTPTTFRYRVHASDNEVDDVLCVDIEFLDKRDDDDLLDGVRVRIRDDAYWDGTEYRCPDAPPASGSFTRAALSNPVHTALAPVHARRAASAAHGAVRNLVRRWRPGASRPLSAVSPAIGIGSLSGRSDGFDYDGSSESLSAGAELGAGSWQAGAVASFTRTELDYRADASLSARGYRAGEHDTRIFSLHPFAAWHLPSGGHLWASLGAGTGELRHRDDPGFPSRSRSDLRLLAHAVGGSVPLADLLSGEVQAEAGIESFALEIEGGGRISSSLPTLRGHDYRAGLAWSAPVSGAPSLSMAYRHQTGDGPAGGRLETEGSVSFEGFLDPRLSLTGSAAASFGPGGQERRFWRLGGGLRFAPDVFGRGFGLDLDTGLVSPTDGRSPAVAVRGEVGYGLRGGTLLRAVRPYAGLMRRSGGDAVRRSLGVDIGGTPGSRLKVEAYDNSPDRSRGIALTWRRRF